MRHDSMRSVPRWMVGVAALMAILTADASTITTLTDGRQPAAATSIPLASPRGVVVDASGNMYFANSDNHTVFRVDAVTRIATVVAGSGVCGFSGDGGPATSAALCDPYGVALDSAGRLVIADSSNGRVRRVGSDGRIQTIAGGADCCALNDGGNALGAWLGFPSSVAVDAAGNLFIADSAGYRIRKVDAAGTISTFAGNGTCCYEDTGTGPAIDHAVNNAFTVSVDPSGNIWTNAGAFGLTHKIFPNGVIALVSLTGPNYGRAFDQAGNMIVSVPFCCSAFDTSGWAQVLKFDPRGNFVAPVAGVHGAPGFNGDGSPATEHQLNFPYAVAAGVADAIVIADSNNHRIRKVDSVGQMTTVAGNGVRAQYQMTPFSAVVDSNGALYFSDAQSNYVRKIDGNGTLVTVVAGSGSWGFTGDGLVATASALAGPNKIALAQNGDLYIADAGNNRIRRVSAGVMTTVAGYTVQGYDGEGTAYAHALCNPTGIAVDGAGNLYIADSCNHRVRRVDATSGAMTTFAGTGSPGIGGDGGMATAAMLDTPVAVAVDATGAVYVADSGNHRVRRISATGIISTVIGNGSCSASNDGPGVSVALCSPQDVQVISGGRLVVADLNNNRILVQYPSGNVSTVAGNGAFGYSGDGGSALSAMLAQPYGVGADSAGNLFIADTQNHRIRKVSGVPVNEPPKQSVSISIINLPANAAFGGSFVPAYAYTGDGSRSVTTATSGICSVSGNAVTFVGAGLCKLTAKAAATTNYVAATGVQQSFTVAKAVASIAINNLPAGAQFGQSFTPTYAYAGNGSKSVTSNTPLICTVSGSGVDFVATGTCWLMAHAASTSTYAAATGAAQYFTIAKAITTIAIRNLPSGPRKGSTFKPAYTYAGDGATSTTSSPPAVCTVTGTTVTFVTVGTCTLVAQAEATLNYAKAVGAAQSLTVKP